MAIKRANALPQIPAASNVENASPAPAEATPTLHDTSVPVEEAAAAPVPQVQSAPSHAVAAPLPAIPGHGGLPAIADDEDDGFSNLDDRMGFGSFPIIKLDKNLFALGDRDIGSEIFVQLLGSRDKTFYKERGKAKSEYMFYTYDNIKDISGRDVAAVLAEWKAKGIDWDTKAYSECVAKLLKKTATGFEAAGVVLLNVAPASVARLSGYRFEIKNFKHKKVGQVITRVFPGDKITTKTKETFYPWNFEFAGDLPAELI